MKKLLILSFGMFAIGTGSFIMAGLLPEVAESLNVNVGTAAGMIAAFAAAYALMTPISATLLVNFSYKPILIFGMAVLAVGHILSAASSDLELIIAGRALAGFGCALYMPIAGAAATAIVAQEYWARSLSLITAGLSASTAIGAPLGIALSTSFGDWRLGMWFVAILASLAAIGLGFLLDPALKPATRKRPLDLLKPIKRLSILGVLGTTLFLMTGSYIVHSYASVLLEPATAGNGQTLALMMACWGVAATIGTFSAGRLTDKWGGRTVIFAGLGLLGLDFLIWPLLSSSPVMAVVPIVVWGALAWGCLVPLQHQLVKTAPSSASIVLGLNTSAIYLGVSFSTFIGKHVYQTLGTDSLNVVAAGFIVLAFGIYSFSHHISLNDKANIT